MLINARIQLDVAACRDAFEAGQIDPNRPRTDENHVHEVLPHPGFHIHAVEVTAGNGIGHAD